jgi:hypothetical protein
MVLDLAPKSLEGLEVGFGDCPTGNRAGLATKTFQTLLDNAVTASEFAPASNETGNPKTHQDDDRK